MNPGSGILNLNAVDWSFLAFYLAIIIVVGLLARRSVATSEDFFLSGRSMPAWVTGLAFISANLGALEILGNAANGAQYGLGGTHFYWLGAIPAMLVLGVFLMPFYYSTKVHSVPEYMRRRFNPATHLLNSVIFAIAQLMLAGVNLYALALVIHGLVGVPIWVSIVTGAAVILIYIVLGGLSSAIYTEVLQFFVIIAGLIPLVIIGLHHVGGFDGLRHSLDARHFDTFQEATPGSYQNPLGDIVALILGEGFVLSFGYWTTNFAEIQRTLSAKNLSAARRTPIIAAFPKMFFPLLTVIPGMIALVIIPKLGEPGGPSYNDAIPQLMERFLPNGVLGIALTGLLAAFMAGSAANVSGFNTVATYDIIKQYLIKNRSDRFYLSSGRWVTVGGIIVSIATAFIAAGYSNIQNYLQLLFSFFNSPLFAVFIIGLFWKRLTPWAAFAGLLLGTIGAAVSHFIFGHLDYFYPYGRSSGIAAQVQNFYSAIAAFVITVVVMIIVTSFTRPKPERELHGLVWGMRLPDDSGGATEAWWSRPVVLASIASVLIVALGMIAYLWR